MTDNGNGVVNLMKKVGIVCGGALAAGTLLQILGAFVWGQATRPMVTKIDALAESQREERIPRQYNDSLIVQQVAKIGEAMLYPLGSTPRERAIDKVIDAPEAQQEQLRANERRRR